MRIDFHDGLVVKSAESEDDRIRLCAEARALRACAHPGVVGMVALDGGADRPDRLTLRRLARSLADAGPQPAAVVAGQGAAVLTTLADLHELGWVHRAVEASHVLLDEEGRPVLCGFGHAERPSAPSELASLAALDVAAVAALLRDRLPASADRRLHRLLARAAGERGRGRPPTARQMAKRIVDIQPDARLGPPAAIPTVPSAPAGPSAPDGPSAPRVLGASGSSGAYPGSHGAEMPGSAGEPVGASGADPGTVSGGVDDGFSSDARWGLSRSGRAVRRGPARTLIIGAAATAAVLLIATAIASGAWHPSGSSARPAPGSNLALRTTSDRFMMADPNGPMVTVIGAWGCGARRPAGLDLRTGWVWTFPSWPGPGSSVPGRPVGQVVGATGLAVQATSAECDALVVLGPRGRRLVMSGSAGRPGREKATG